MIRSYNDFAWMLFCIAIAFSGCAESRKWVTTHEWHQPINPVDPIKESREPSRRMQLAKRTPKKPAKPVAKPKPKSALPAKPTASMIAGRDQMFQQFHQKPVGEKKAFVTPSEIRLASQSNELLLHSEPEPIETPAIEQSEPTATSFSSYSISAPPNTVQLNLPTALSLVNGKHPAVGLARWRVQEAYARLDRSKVLWLPSIQPGFSFHKHDGNYQPSNGSIADVNRNSFQYGLGAGATGAGTTQLPGIVARFHLADAIFQPAIAQKAAWAKGHNANGVQNKQMLDVSLAYLQLLNAEQKMRIVEETHQRTSELTKLTDDFAATGQGLQADADRMQTELRLVENRMATAREHVDVASAKLAYALSIDAGKRIVPLDVTVVPLQLVSLDQDKASLISAGLSNRPELKEAQALVAVACEQYKRQKYAPLVPSVLLGYSTGGFGGGLGNQLDDIDNRYDFDAVVTWEIRNLGFGEKSARRETAAQYQQARYKKLKALDQVAKEVAEAHSQAIHRSGRVELTQRAIESAENSYQRNLARIRDGEGLPLEVLQSVRALDEARHAYLKAVIDHNEAQFRLQWALGWPTTENLPNS